MKDYGPNRLTWLISSIIAAAVFIVGALVFLSFSLPVYSLQLAILSIVAFLLQFFILRYVLQRFIEDRIKLIYKTIHRLKLSREAKKEKLHSLKGDVIQSVNKEVIAWANTREAEIQRLMVLEEYRREFLGNVSHELKTPLFNLQGFTHTLIDGGINDPEINVDYLKKVEKNIDRMITIVNELEVISHLESGEIRLEIVRFDIHTLSREVMEFLEPMASVRKITLLFHNDDYPPQYVMGDREKIRQVMVNLLENSIKYGKEGGRTKVSFYNMDDTLLIEVADNGIGIEAVHLPHLFERFYRVDKHRSRNSGGSGLGLAIVKHIIVAHQQTINVRSTVGIGSTFSFTLKKA